MIKRIKAKLKAGEPLEESEEDFAIEKVRSSIYPRSFGAGLAYESTPANLLIFSLHVSGSYLNTHTCAVHNGCCTLSVGGRVFWGGRGVG